MTRADLQARILAQVKQYGPQSAKELEWALEVPERSLRNALEELRNHGVIHMRPRRYSGNGGCGCALFCEAKAVLIPRLSAGEYLGWRPSGTSPSDIGRALK